MNYGNFKESLVYNRMNETNLEYIGIFGLFGRYNIEIPFDKQVNIFIGENGLGKTTILNCIYFLLEKKFSRLASMQFSEIMVKFKSEKEMHVVSHTDIREYNKKNRFKFKRDFDTYSRDVIRHYLYTSSEIDFSKADERELDLYSYEISKHLGIPIREVRYQIHRMFEEDEAISGKKHKGNPEKVSALAKAISDKINHRIIYLPTYRRIEDDLSALNIRNEEINQAELLIRFGMSDVQSSIDRILDNIRELAMKGFTEMTGVLLRQYADGTSPVLSASEEMDYETVKIVLDRVGDEIEDKYKEKILDLVRSGQIGNDEYLHLWNLINKLIINYRFQKAYDDKIKKFAETCNKYLNDKFFYYNQSTLKLNIYLDNDTNDIIPLTQLSSGEKQIVSLFSKLYLESDDRSIVIIDEPELSLSLQWQKKLLPDIMRTDNCDLLLTVTHSPFIFDNEFDYDAKEIRRYIKMYR